ESQQIYRGRIHEGGRGRRIPLNKKREAWPKFTGAGARNQIGIVGGCRFVHVEAGRIARDTRRVKNEEQTETRQQQKHFHKVLVEECPAWHRFEKARAIYHAVFGSSCTLQRSMAL